MSDKPFSFQNDGVEWLKTKRFALLADEMGLGKSMQTVIASEYVGAGKVLIICPSVARLNHEAEMERWSIVPRKVFVCRKLSDSPPLHYSVICSYNYATKNVAKLKSLGPWDVTIADEVHLVKVLTSERTAAILGSNGIIRATTRFWAVSGTPMPNGKPSELWLLLYTFGVTPLDYHTFCETYCTGYHYQGRFNPTGPKKNKIPELKIMLSKFMLRRKKEDVMKELPPIHFLAPIIVEPGVVDLEGDSTLSKYVFPVDRRLEFENILNTERTLVKSMMNTAKTGPELMRMIEAVSESVSTLRRYTGLQKVDAAVEMITEELTSKAYDKIVIFAVHRDAIIKLREGLAKFGAFTVFGGSDPDAVRRNIARFQNPDDMKIRVCVGNIQAAGTNLTLTAAHNVLFVEMDWVPGNNAQAAMRCHRIGQTKPVVVRFLALNNPMDHKIIETLKKKTKEIAEIFS